MTTATKGLQKVDAMAVIPGLENADNDDLILPRINLLQPISKPVVNDGHKSGTFLNSQTKEAVSKLVIIPVGFKKEFWLVDGQSPAQRVLVTTEKDHAGLVPVESKDPNEVRKVQKVLDFMVIVNGNFAIPTMIRFTRSSYWTGRQLFTDSQLERIPLFSNKYTLAAKKVDGDKGTYFSPAVESREIIKGKELEQAQMVYDRVKGLNVVAVDPEAPGDAQEEAPF